MIMIMRIIVYFKKPLVLQQLEEFPQAPRIRRQRRAKHEEIKFKPQVLGLNDQYLYIIKDYKLSVKYIPWVR
jgi:hypothetical protein